MKENKLGTYLTSFTEDDWSGFQNFSKSKYSEKSHCQAIINYIKKRKNRLDPTYMNTEFLREKISPTTKKAVFANAVSRLCKYIEEYMIHTEVENDNMMKDTLLLQALGKRGLSTQFHKNKKKAKERRDNMPAGLWNNYHGFMAEYFMYFCNMTSDISVSKVILQNAHAEIHKFHQVVKSYLIVESHNRSILLNENWDQLINQSNLPHFDNCIQKEVFLALMNLKEKRELSSFNILKNKLFNENLSHDLKYTILIHLTSFINGQKVRGEIESGKEILNLYQFGLENNILFPNGLIPLVRYVNIIGVACDMNEFNWATNFINTYSYIVTAKNTEEILVLGQTMIEFSKGNYSKVINRLRQVRYKDFEIEARARWYLLSSYYEINKNDPSVMESHITAYLYLLNKSKEKTTKLTILGLSKSVKYLSYISKNNFTDTLLSKIKSEKTLYFRKWLYQKTLEKHKKVSRI